jgi:hypothetical protein
MLHKHKKKPKVQRRQLRNAAAPRSATMRVPRSNAAAPLPTATLVSPLKKPSLPETLQTAGGAAGAALACAFIARENWVPPKFVAGLVTAVGGTMALLAKNDTVRHVGAGVMSAAGAQLGLMLVDNHYDNLATQQRIAAAVAQKAAADKAKAEQAKATRSAESLPPGALEAAYERARARVAMAQAASQLAPG